MAGIEEKALSFIEAQGLLPPGEGVVVGVSGGPDSACLLHLLSRLRPRLGIRLWAGYLDHGLRGEEGEADGSYVAALCQGLEVPLSRHKVDTSHYRRQHRLSGEEAARQLRYDFLAHLASKVGAPKVAVGHTADDQVETVLLHLLRGSGLRGLRGMASKSHWGEVEIIRPLLEISRKETEGYCREWELNPRQDSTNLSTAFTRNRLRQEVIPLLKSINPGFSQALLRASHSLAQDLNLIEAELSQIRPNVVMEDGGGVALSRHPLLGLHPSLQHHLLLRVAEEREISLEEVHVAAMLASLSRPGTSLSLPGGHNWVVEYDRAWLGKGLPSPPYPSLPGEHPIAVPGVSRFSGWRVHTHIVSPPPTLQAGPFTTFLDGDKVGTGLVVRGWQPGDRFQPLGIAQEKKLQDFFVDARIPRSWRRNIPLLLSSQGILWVVGYRIDERAKVTSQTSRVLMIEFQRE